jgi:hypothetical protein
MPRLYCKNHGREREAGVVEQRDVYRRAGETLLVVTGTLISGPWYCDRCNLRLQPGNLAVLVSAFPSHYCDELCNYDFGYERQYFAMIGGDKAAAYGAGSPDGAIRSRL